MVRIHFIICRLKAIYYIYFCYFVWEFNECHCITASIPFSVLSDSLTPLSPLSFSHSLFIHLTPHSFCFMSHHYYHICRQLLLLILPHHLLFLLPSFKYSMHFPYYLNHVSAKYATFEFLNHLNLVSIQNPFSNKYSHTRGRISSWILATTYI